MYTLPKESLTVIEGKGLLVGVVVEVGEAEGVEEADGDTDEELGQEQQTDDGVVLGAPRLRPLTVLLAARVTQLLRGCRGTRRRRLETGGRGGERTRISKYKRKRGRRRIEMARGGRGRKAEEGECVMQVVQEDKQTGKRKKEETRQRTKKKSKRLIDVSAGRERKKKVEKEGE